jgi:hypothetical protein
MTDYRQWRSLREIDCEAGQAKGSAFRRFKRLGTMLVETRDYIVLHHQADAEAIAALRASGRIYQSSVNVILLSASAAQRILEVLQARAATASGHASKTDY